MIAVTPQVFDLLAYLIRHRERVVTKDGRSERALGGGHRSRRRTGEDRLAPDEPPAGDHRVDLGDAVGRSGSIRFDSGVSTPAPKPGNRRGPAMPPNRALPTASTATTDVRRFMRRR